MPDVTVQYNRLDPHIEEDRRLVLLADFPEGPNVLEHLKLDDWKKAFPCLDRLETVRLLGGLGMRLLQISRCLHWELRQSVDGVSWICAPKYCHRRLPNHSPDLELCVARRRH